MSGPTQRSLAHLRGQGYLAAVVEKWNSFTKTRHDLYGFIDILAVRDNEIVGVQATDGSSVPKRIRKITEHENVAAVRKSGMRILVHGWTKRKGRYVLREVDLS